MSDSAQRAGEALRRRALALPDAHGVHAHCRTCGWDGPRGRSRSGAVSDYVKHNRTAHPEGTTQISVFREDA